MSYLYAGLGIAMLSGIIAMMQIGNNVNKFINLISKDNQILKDYIDSNSPSYDKDIIKILYENSSSLPETDICKYLVSKINENKLNTSSSYFIGPPDTTVPSNKFFDQSCALENIGGDHRAVINKTSKEKYELFSCSEKEKVGNYCKFEMGDRK